MSKYSYNKKKTGAKCNNNSKSNLRSLIKLEGNINYNDDYIPKF